MRLTRTARLLVCTFFIGHWLMIAIELITLRRLHSLLSSSLWWLGTPWHVCAQTVYCGNLDCLFLKDRKDSDCFEKDAKLPCTRYLDVNKRSFGGTEVRYCLQQVYSLVALVTVQVTAACLRGGQCRSYQFFAATSSSLGVPLDLGYLAALCR